MSITRAQVFDALSVVTIAAAIGVSAWRGTSVAASEFALPAVADNAAPSTPNAATTNADSAAIVSANVFSASRRAPRVHYVSPDAMAAMMASEPIPSVLPVVDSSTMSASGVSNADSVPRLYGIVSQNGVRRALLRLSNKDHAPELFVEGDRHSGWQVVRIDADRVTLRGASGQRTLRLAAHEPSDSSGKRF